jgi:hypothetical protein
MGKRELSNVTITLDAATLAKARVKAAESSLSLSRFIGNVVREHVGGEDAYEVAMRAALAQKPLDLKGAAERYLTREQVNDRAALRRR